MEIISEFLGQIIKLVFYLILLVGAVNLGIFFRKKKNLSDANKNLENNK